MNVCCFIQLGKCSRLTSPLICYLASTFKFYKQNLKMKIGGQKKQTFKTSDRFKYKANKVNSKEVMKKYKIMLNNKF